jgi:hypothetical protein
MDRARGRDLVGQRVFGIALGYVDLNDHDELRHDPIMAILEGKLTARRKDCAPVAGKSTLNRLELSKLEPRAATRSATIRWPSRLLVDLFVEAHERPPKQINLDLDDDPLHGEQEGRFFHGYLPLYVFCGRRLRLRKMPDSHVPTSFLAYQTCATAAMTHDMPLPFDCHLSVAQQDLLDRIDNAPSLPAVVGRGEVLRQIYATGSLIGGASSFCAHNQRLCSVGRSSGTIARHHALGMMRLENP